MTMIEPWYEEVPASSRLTQGDLVFDCPVLTWSDDASVLAETIDGLKASVEGRGADLVVMTQACDLENEKVEAPVLCPHVALGDHKTLWENELRGKSQVPTPRAWGRYCDRLKDGFLWDHALLDQYESASAQLEHRVVYFGEVFSVPRVFLEKLLAGRAKPRLRLRPPYREHLSQAFARFFMRVGLPTAVKKTW